jgi:hypothetical protein
MGLLRDRPSSSGFRFVSGVISAGAGPIVAIVAWAITDVGPPSGPG